MLTEGSSYHQGDGRKWGTYSDHQRLLEFRGEGVQVNQVSRILAKVGQYKDRQGNSKVEDRFGRRVWEVCLKFSQWHILCNKFSVLVFNLIEIFRMQLYIWNINKVLLYRSKTYNNLPLKVLPTLNASWCVCYSIKNVEVIAL
jgi:hypothetical protein